jgi:threonine aldolase
MTYSFRNDYSEGAHPSILEALGTTNLQQEDGYGEDRFCREAAGLLRDKMNSPDADIHFLTGGTQTNLIAISAFLRPHEAAIAAETGHVLVHETGAIEATGHKIIAMPAREGKLSAEAIESAVLAHTDEHMVKPRLVYLSQSTEIGSIYGRAELEGIREMCDRHHLLLYVDGARLGSALVAEGADCSLSDMARLTDAFYVGGTKNGALLGEALVLNNAMLKPEFRYHMKQKGALLAKGRVVGIQFRELFRNGLYESLALHANRMSGLIRSGIAEDGFHFLTDSPTNQIFPILPNKLIGLLEQTYGFYVWAPHTEETSSIRLVTSWATPESAVLTFVQDFHQAVARASG